MWRNLFLATTNYGEKGTDYARYSIRVFAGPRREAVTPGRVDGPEEARGGNVVFQASQRLARKPATF